MPTYVAFLRAVNLGRTRKVPMAQARAWLTEAGMREVESYIQSGNLRFTTSMRSRERVEQTVERVLAEACGFDVPTIAVTPAELREVYDGASQLPAPVWPDPRRYVTFLKEQPGPDVAAEVEGWTRDGLRVDLIGRAVHWWIDRMDRASAMSNAELEKLLGPATTRDFKVVTTLAERWGDRRS